MTDDGVGRKPRFAQRHGYAPFDTSIQVESLDDQARLDIWNLVIYQMVIADRQPVVDSQVVWALHLAQERNRYNSNACANALHSIVFDQEWHQVYDLLEFLVQQAGYRRRDVVVPLNNVLATNRAGYRAIDDEIVPITNPAEIGAIESAVHSPLTDAAEHIKRALTLFADRDTPNFSKVINESISGAEAAARVLAGTPSATLADALTAVGKQGSTLHPALIEGWKRIYGFTSDSGGIRHALKEGTVDPDQDLAQYFIITCSAFVNLAAAITSK